MNVWKIATVLVLALCCWNSPGSLSAAAGLRYLPMVGSVTDTSVSIWIRTDMPVESAVVQYQPSGGNWFQRSESVSVRITATTDYTAIIKIPGLSAATAYDYRVVLDGSVQPSSVSGFKTLPATGAGSRFSFLFGSGIQQDYRPHGIFNNMALQQADFALLLGDTATSSLSSTPATESDFWSVYKAKSQRRRVSELRKPHGDFQYLEWKRLRSG
jgi:phosphodiesterase/alkaline phosphatase D-like protein